MSAVPIGVGKARTVMGDFVGLDGQVAGGGRQGEGAPIGAQLAALQVHVVGKQRQAAGGGDGHAAAAAVAVGALVACERHAAAACAQCQVSAIAQLAEREGAAPPVAGVEGDVALALDDGQVGGAHQHRVGIQPQRAAGLDAGLAADGAQARGGGAYTLHAGAVQGQVAGFVEHAGCTAAVKAIGVGLGTFAGQAQHVFGDHVSPSAGDLACGAGAGEAAAGIGLGVPVGQVAVGVQGNVARAVELAAYAGVGVEQGAAAGGGDGDVARPGRGGFVAVGADVSGIGLHGAALNGYAASGDAAAGWVVHAIDGIRGGGDEGQTIGQDSGLPGCAEAGGHHLHLAAGPSGGVDAAHREVFAGGECAG